MTVNLQDAQTLTYLACRLRAETYGCGNWDQAGTFSVIRELIGQNYAESLHRVVGHAMDPEARTPGAIRRPFVPKRTDEPGRRQPAKAGEDCLRHPGEYVGSCRPCSVEHLHAPTDPVLDDDRTAGRELLAEIRARRHGGNPEPSPAHGVPAPSEPPAPPVTSRADVGDDHGPASAGEPDRPETACAADGCYRPTRDGICDRCREKAAAEDIDAANAELVDRLRANERARAHTRPAPDPAAQTRYFTGVDYDPQRVHAAQARAATQRSNA